ncbi:EthD domain-containing protein [Xenophilus arseniciresistens]|uniref:EthD domain-containing protein n=1 Tax=Xenophilus arseniciresistens TaxID=1283306 RepID=A0AAE3T195_9BURK|nr:EthD domain-containing protein [Xenophilus arseniciresistens]MDA7418984.1 EthD domain-containing protein [Xenophilus arseniciresistens]
MQAHLLCLSGDAAVRAALPKYSPELPVHLYQVLRHIPTDSVSAEQAQRPIVPGAEGIAWIVEIGFADAPAQARVLAQPAWRDFEAALGASGERLFAFDTAPNLPIVPKGAAAAGGFRRWMLLERAAATPAAFKEGWFGRHADLVKQLPGVDGYVQHLVSESFGADGRPLGRPAICVDGIAELCFADEAAMQASYASDARLPLRDDGRALLGGIVTLLVQGRPA